MLPCLHFHLLSAGKTLIQSPVEATANSVSFCDPSDTSSKQTPDDSKLSFGLGDVPETNISKAGRMKIIAKNIYIAKK